MTRTAGSMCTGYGGLEMAVALATGGDLDVRWHAEVAPGPAAVLDKRQPDVPNLGDITATAWNRQPRVDTLLAGFPCQGNSNAGQRRGRADERWLWPAVFEGIVALQPAEVFIENVENLLRIDGGEAFADILADLAGAGYHARWTTVGACAVGLAHHRHRVFLRAARQIVRPAWTRDAAPLTHLLFGGWSPVPRWPRAGRMHGGIVWAEEAPKCGAPRAGGRLMLPTPVARDGDPKQRGEGSVEYWRRRLLAGRTNGMPLGAAVRMLPTPRAADGDRGSTDARDRLNGRPLPETVRLLPTPTSSLHNDGENLEQWETRRARNADRHGNNGNGTPLTVAARLLPTPRASDVGTAGRRASAGWRPPLSQVVLPDAERHPTTPRMGPLLPTPRASDGAKGGPGQRGSSGDLALPSAVLAERFGAYADAIALHVEVTGVEPPDPTEPNRRGDLRLSPAFAEWMMGGVPAGWVTDVLDRVPALQCVGNGVVPLQGAVAYVLTGGR